MLKKRLADGIDMRRLKMHFRQDCYFLFIMVLGLASGNDETDKEGEKVNLTLTTSPEPITFYVEKPVKVMESSTITIPWSSSIPGVKSVDVYVEDEAISFIANHEESFNPNLSNYTSYVHLNASVDDSITVEGYVNMTAKFIGFNKLFVVLRGKENKVLLNGSLEVGVTLEAQYLTKVYQICLTVILIIVYTNMGANLDLELVKKILREPVGPAIGLFCQYVCMPVIAFSLGLLIFPNEPLFHLGLFASGCSPGGGLSNMWTHLLGGSLDLSIMMTFTSTVVALGTVPLWLLTLGKVILKDVAFHIPYTNVLKGIAMLIMPCFVGILIQLKLPRVTKIMKIILTPLSLINILFIFTFGVYTNFYLFSYITWKAVGAGFGQSLIGHAAGFLFAFLGRRSFKEMIAISIETAIQNNGVAFLILKMSLGKPAGDLAVLLPGCVALFMPIPLLIAFLIKTICQMILGRKKGIISKDCQQQNETVELPSTETGKEEAAQRKQEVGKNPEDNIGNGEVANIQMNGVTSGKQPSTK